MKRMLVVKSHILKFYAAYSRPLNMAAKLVVAIVFFRFITKNTGFAENISNAAVTSGLAIICAFLPFALTAVIGAVLLSVQFFAAAPGMALAAGLILTVMAALYLRFSPRHTPVLVLTPISFLARVPMLAPLIGALMGEPILALPLTFGVIVFHMVKYAAPCAQVVKALSDASATEQAAAFLREFLSNREMWMETVATVVCFLVAASIASLGINHARELAILAGVLSDIIMTTIGYVAFDLRAVYAELLIGSAAAAVLAVIFSLFFYSCNYEESKRLRFEDDEYYYYVKAVPKVYLPTEEKTVTEINKVSPEEEPSDAKSEGGGGESPGRG